MEDWEKDGQRQRVRQRAYRRLADMHPKDFGRLHDEERAKEGLSPIGGNVRAHRPELSTEDMAVDYRNGMTSTSIAAKYQCSTQTVIARLRKAKVRMRAPGHPGWTQES